MAAQAGPANGPRRNPPRLNIINPSISYSQQQAQALFSPALQTAIHTGVGSGFPIHTPMQPYFGIHNHPQGGPPRHGHQNRASISHFASQSPLTMVTPTANHFSRPSMMLGHGAPSQPFAIGPGGPGQPLGPITLNNGPPAGHRPHRRQMSIGGPPKAVLGGPQRKVSPNPSAIAIAAVGAATLKKKITVNLPKETELVDVEADAKDASEKASTSDSEQEIESTATKTRISKEWARIPLSVAEGETIVNSYVPLSGEDLISRQPFFPEEWRSDLPAAIDVFLPGKATWDRLKQQVIEAKLEKLGVEPASGSNFSHIYAPHARAASISSPADPALLMFRLNKLHQTQSAQALSPSVAASNSLAPSPQPPTGLSPPPQNRRHSPSALGPNASLFQNRHGHTMSLAQPPSYTGNGLNPNFNPFASSGSASIGDDFERPWSTVSDGPAPVTSSGGDLDGSSSLNVPPLSAISRPASRPDFIRGFGLDVPEEAEEEAELDEQEQRDNKMRWKQRHDLSDDEEQRSEADQDREDESGHTGDTEEDDEELPEVNRDDGEEDMELDDETSLGGTTASHSRMHSRHASKLSAALSLRSVGGNLSAIMGSRGSGLEEEVAVDGDGSFMGRESSPPPQANRRPPLPSMFDHAIKPSLSANREDLEDAVAVQEWTASEEESPEDTSDFDDSQSLGEYSNPSDEERARRQRVERRMGTRAQKEEAKRRKQLLKRKGDEAAIRPDREPVEGEGEKEGSVVDQPRRIPNFPRPPDSPLVFVPTQREHYHQLHPAVFPQPHHQHEVSRGQDRDEIISNPSEENLVMGPHEYRYPSSVGAAALYPPPPQGQHHHPYQHGPQFLGITPSPSQPDFYNGGPPGGMRSPHALPGVVAHPHSHSRGPSETLSYTSHGHQNQGSLAHSSSFGRVASPPTNPYYTHQHQNSFGQPPMLVTMPQPQPQPQLLTSSGNSSARRESLNPFAKPFVFGRPLDAKAEPWQPSSISKPTSTTTTSPTPQVQADAAPTSSQAISITHSRLPSLGKALNVAAPEFKPRSATLPTEAEFTFSMPTVTPAFPVPEPSVPLSVLAALSSERNGALYEDGSPIKKQGREKRPRLGSAREVVGDEDVEFVEVEIIAQTQPIEPVEVREGEESSQLEEGNDSMASFRFPGPGRIESPKMIRKAYSHQPQQVQSSLAVERVVGTTVSLDGSFSDGGREGANGGSEFGNEVDLEDVDSEEEDKENRREDTPAPASASASMVIAKSGLFDTSLSRSQKAEHREGAPEQSESVANDSQEIAEAPVDAAAVSETHSSDEDENVQEIIIPPTLPFTNLSATFPTSATMRSANGSAGFSPINGNTNKTRRAPIPLDFKHPSGNTVPAGLFKALVQNVVQQNRDMANNAGNANLGRQSNSDDQKRHDVRSRLGSREMYEMHMSRPSMDDLNVTRISGTGISSTKSLSTLNANANRSIHLPNFTGTVAHRSRNATDPIPDLSRREDEEDVFGTRNADSSKTREKNLHQRRRSSLPDALRDRSSSASPSESGHDEDDLSDEDQENHYGNTSMNANPGHTMHITQSGRRVLGSMSISRSQSPEQPSRIQRMRRSEAPSRSPSVLPDGFVTQLDLHALEDVLTRVLDERLSELRREWSHASLNDHGGESAASPGEAMLSEVISLFRAQLQDSATKSLEDTTMEARGEMDMFMIRDMLEEGQREVVGVVKTVVKEHLNQALIAAQDARDRQTGSEELVHELRAVVENASGRTMRAVVETISDFRARQEAAAAAATPAHQHEMLLDDMVTTLTPMLQGLRAEPVDYEFLTNHLAQAVKPHISQLIDLASDKRETADMIVHALVPTLVNTLVPSLVPSLTPSLISVLAPTLVDTLSERMRVEGDESRLSVVREVRRAVEGVDAIEIRERVADLVVERLDARLDARDKSFIGAVNSSITNVTEKMAERLDANESSNSQQEKRGLSEEDLKVIEKRIVEGLKEAIVKYDRVPAMLEGWFDRVKLEKEDGAKKALETEASNREDNARVLSAIGAVIDQAVSKGDISTLEEKMLNAASEASSSASTSTSEVRALLQALTAENKVLAEKNAELASSHHAMSNKLASLPDTLNQSIVTLQNGISELIVSRDVPKKELEELRKQNSEYQNLVTKARAAHGQVRVEKDLLGEKLTVVESERDKLRVKLAEIEIGRKEEVAAAEARKYELEEALANALGRLQASDVAAQMHQQKVSELEKAVKEISAEKATLKSGLDALEIRATVADAEKASAVAMLDGVRREQGHWDGLRQASEKIDMLTKLIGEVESDEIKELRRYHDRTKAFEGDHLALQKRCKDLESKLVNSEKLSTATKSSLLQAQQRSAEWEARAKEYEGELEMTRTKLEQAEQTQSQLDADHSMLKLQFEEREADDRLYKDRENRLREQNSALEAKVVRLQDELLKARTTPRTPYRNVTNGSASHPPPRPDSRSSVSTLNGRDRQVSSYSPANNVAVPPKPSVWDSIHAPSNDSSIATSSPGTRYPSVSGVSSSLHAPKSRYPNLGPTSTPKQPLTRKAVYASTYSRANAPSPAPSNVSAAPTQRDDGWWE